MHLSPSLNLCYVRFSSFLKYLGTNFFAKFSDNKKKVVNLFFNRRKERRSRYTMALKNVNIPLNIKDYPENSSINISRVSYLSSEEGVNTIDRYASGLLIIGENNSAHFTFNSLIVGSNNTSSSYSLFNNSNSNFIMVGDHLLTESYQDQYDNTIQNGVIIGQYNNPIESPRLVIGNGTAEKERSNIVEVTTDSINLTPTSGVSFKMNSSGSTFTGPLTIDTIQGNSITLRGELRVSEIYENDSTDNINFRNNAVFHTGVTFNDNINLQNNTISGGATLNGTYTFDAENGLKIGNKTIQSRGAGTLTLPVGSGTLAKTSSLYWVMFNIDWRTHIHDKGIQAAYSVNGNTYSEFTTLYDVAGDVYGLFLSGVSIPAYPSGQYSFKTAVSGSIQTFNSNSNNYPLQSYNLYYAYADADDSPGFLYLIGGAYYGTSEDGYAWHSIKLKINLVSVKFSSDKFDIG